MLPDRVSNPGPLTYKLGALPIALRGPASKGYLIQRSKEKFMQVRETCFFSFFLEKKGRGR